MTGCERPCKLTDSKETGPGRESHQQSDGRLRGHSIVSMADQHLGFNFTKTFPKSYPCHVWPPAVQYQLINECCFEQLLL